MKQDILRRAVEKRIESQHENIFKDVGFFREQAMSKKREEILNTINDFLSFSTDFKSFMTKLLEKRLKKSKEPLDDKSLNRLVLLKRLIASKVSREWLSLRPALMQRTDISSQHLQNHLMVADKWLQSLLPFEHNETVYAYFNKTYSIAKHKYRSRIPTVSIPLDMWDSQWHWLGTAHEIGHYVYSNIVKNGEGREPTTLQSLLEKNLLKNFMELFETWEDTSRFISLWGDWLEEIFADCYGAVVLGPAYIESLMVYIAPICIQSGIFHNDNDHAMPVLRPLIQIAAINELMRYQKENSDTKLHQDLETLNDEWLNYCVGVAENTDLAALFDGTVGGLEKEKVEGAIAATAKAFVDTLQNMFGTKLSKHLPLYDSQQHEQVSNAMKDSFAATTGEAPGKNDFAVYWSLWKDKLTNEGETEVIQNQIRQQLIKSGTQEVSAQAAGIDAKKRPFYKDFLGKHQVVVQDEMLQHVIDTILNHNEPELSDEIRIKIDFLIGDLLSVEFSTEETAACDWAQKCDTCKQKVAPSSRGTKCNTCNIKVVPCL